MAYASVYDAISALSTGTANLADLREIVVSYPQLRPVVATYAKADDALLDWLAALHDPLVDAKLAERRTDSPAEATTPAPDQGAPTLAAQTVAGRIWPAGPPPQSTPDPFGASTQSTQPADPAAQPYATGPQQPYPAAPAQYPTQPADPAAQPYATGPQQPYPAAPAQYPTQPLGQYPTQPPAQYATPYPTQPPTQYPTQPPAQPQPRRRIGLLVALIALALVVVGGGIGAAFATGLIGKSSSSSSRPSSAPPSATHNPATPVPPSASTSATESTLPTPETSAPDTPIQSGFVCWDGAQATSLAECLPPPSQSTGYQYLRYVFPSLATHQGCSKVDRKTLYSGATPMWECELGDALVRYSYWEKVSDADRHYHKKFTSATTLRTYPVLIGGVEVDGWFKTSRKTATGPGGVKRVILTMWLPSQHLSLTVEGNTTASMWAALDLVRVRTTGQELGHPAGTDPDDAPVTAKGR